MILLSPPLPLWLFSGFSVCTSASNTLPLLFSSSGELSNSDPFKVSRCCASALLPVVVRRLGFGRVRPGC